MGLLSCSEPINSQLPIVDMLSGHTEGGPPLLVTIFGGHLWHNGGIRVSLLAVLSEDALQILCRNISHNRRRLQD